MQTATLDRPTEDLRAHMGRLGKIANSNRRVFSGAEARAVGRAYRLLGRGEVVAALVLLEPAVKRHGLLELAEQDG